MSPLSATLSATHPTTTTTRSPPACSALAMRKEARTPARSGCARVDMWGTWKLACLCTSGLNNRPLCSDLSALLPVVSPMNVNGCYVYVCLKSVFTVCLSAALFLCNFRETAAALLWLTTACLRPLGIACWGWWAGERAALWPRSLESTHECLGFCPGYLQPWGWDTHSHWCYIKSLKGWRCL